MPNRHPPRRRRSGRSASSMSGSDRSSLAASRKGGDRGASPSASQPPIAILNPMGAALKAAYGITNAVTIGSGLARKQRRQKSKMSAISTSHASSSGTHKMGGSHSSASQLDGDVDDSGRSSLESSDDDGDPRLIHSTPPPAMMSSSLSVVTFGPSDEKLLSRIRRYHHQQKERPLVAGNVSGLGMAPPTSARGGVGGGTSQVSMLGRGAVTAFDIASRDVTQVLPFPSFVYVERRMMLRSPFSCAEFQHQLLRQALHQAHRERVQRRQYKANLAQKQQQQHKATQQRSSTQGKKTNPAPPSTSRRRGTSLNLHPRKSSEARTAVSAHISRIRKMQLMHTVLAYDEECRRVRNFADRFDEWSEDDDDDKDNCAVTEESVQETITMNNAATVERAASFNQSHTSNSTQGTPKTGMQSSPPTAFSHHRQPGPRPAATTPLPPQLPSPESIMLNVVKLPSMPVVAGQPVIVAYDHRYKVDIPITVRVPAAPQQQQPTVNTEQQVQRTLSSETAEGGDGGGGSDDNGIRTPTNIGSDSDNSSNGGDTSDTFASMLGQRPTAIPPPPPSTTTTTTTTTRYITRTIVERRLYRGVFISAVAGQTLVLAKVSLITIPPEDTQKPGTTSTNATPQRLRTQIPNNSRRGSLVGFHSEDVDETSISSSGSEEEARSSSAAPRRQPTITWDPKIEEDNDVDINNSPPLPNRCALCGRMSCASPATSSFPHSDQDGDQPSTIGPTSPNTAMNPSPQGVGKHQLKLGCAFLHQLLPMLPRGLPSDVEKSHLAQKWKDGEILKFVGPFVTLNMENVIEVIPADRSPEDRAYALAQTTHGNEANARTREVALWNASITTTPITTFSSASRPYYHANNIMSDEEDDRCVVPPPPIFKGLREIKGILCQLAQRCLMETLRKATCTLVCTLPTTATPTTAANMSATSAAASSSSPKGSITYGTRHGCFCTQESSSSSIIFASTMGNNNHPNNQRSSSNSTNRTMENTLVIWEEQQRVQRSYYRGLISILSPLFWNTQTRAYDEYRQRRRGESLRRRVANTDSIQSILASAAARRSGTSKRLLASASDSFNINSSASVSKSLSQQQFQDSIMNTSPSHGTATLRPSSQEIAKRSRRRTRVSGVDDYNPESTLPLFELKNGGSWLAGRSPSVNRGSSSTLSQEPPGYLQAAVVGSEFISALMEEEDGGDNNSNVSLPGEDGSGGERYHSQQHNGVGGGVAAGILEEDESGPPISPSPPGTEMAATLVGSSSSIDDIRSDTDTRAPGCDGSIPSESFEIHVAPDASIKQLHHIPHQQHQHILHNRRRRSQSNNKHPQPMTSLLVGKKYLKDQPISKKLLHNIMAFKTSKRNYMSTFVPLLWRLLNQRKHQLKQQQQGDNNNKAGDANPWDLETSSRASSIHRVDAENMDVAISFGSWVTDLLHVSLALEKHDTSPSVTVPAITAVLQNKGCLSRGPYHPCQQQPHGQDTHGATLTPTAAAGGGYVLPPFGRSVSSLVGTPPQSTAHIKSTPQHATTSANNMHASSTNLEQLFKDLQVETQERRDGQGLLHWATTATYVGDCVTCGGGRGLLPCQCTSCCQAHLEVIPQLLQATTTAPKFINTGTGMFLISKELTSSCMKIASEHNKIVTAAQHQPATISLHGSDLPPPLTRAATTHFSDGDMSISGDSHIPPSTTATTSKNQQQPTYISYEQLCTLALLVTASRDGITAPHHPSAIHTLYLLQSLTNAAQQQLHPKTQNNRNDGPHTTMAATVGTSISQIRRLLYEEERNAAKLNTIINYQHASGANAGGGVVGHDLADSECQSASISTPHTAHLHGGGKSSIVAIRIPRSPQQDGLRTTSFQSVGLGIANLCEDGGDELPAAPSLGASFAFHAGGGGASSLSASNYGTPSLAFAPLPNNASFASISLPRNSPALPPIHHPGSTTTYHHAPINLRQQHHSITPTETPTLSPANHSLLQSTAIPSHIRDPLDLNAPYHVSNTSFGSAPAVLLPPAAGVTTKAAAPLPPPTRSEETALLEITSLVHTYIREPLSAAVEKIVNTKMLWSTSQSHNEEGWMDSVTLALMNWIASSVFAHCVSELSTAISHDLHPKSSGEFIAVIVRTAIQNWFRDIINVPTSHLTSTGYIGVKLPNPNTTPEALLLLSICHSHPSSSPTNQPPTRMRSLTSLESSINKSGTSIPTTNTAYHPQRALQDAAVGAHLMSLREVQDSLLEEKLDAEERFIQGVGVGREVIEARERRDRGGGDEDNMNVDEEDQPNEGGGDDDNLSPSRRDSVVDIQNSDADSDDPPDAGPLGLSSEIATPITSPREARRSTPDIPLVAAHPLPTTKTLAYAVLLKFQGDHVRCPISSELFITPKCTVANPNPAAAIVESAVGEDEAWRGGGSSSGLYVGSHSHADCQFNADPISACINPSLPAPKSWKAAYEGQLATFASIMQMLAQSTTTNNTTAQTVPKSPPFAPSSPPVKIATMSSRVDPLFAALATLLSPTVLASRQAPRPHRPRPSPRTNSGAGGGASRIFKSTKDETEWIIDDYLAQLKGKRCGEVKLAKSVMNAMAPGTDVQSVYSASLLLRYLRTLLVRHEMMKTQAQRAALFQMPPSTSGANSMVFNTENHNNKNTSTNVSGVVKTLPASSIPLGRNNKSSTLFSGLRGAFRRKFTTAPKSNNDSETSSTTVSSESEREAVAEELLTRSKLIDDPRNTEWVREVLRLEEIERTMEREHNSLLGALVNVQMALLVETIPFITPDGDSSAALGTLRRLVLRNIAEKKVRLLLSNRGDNGRFDEAARKANPYLSQVSMSSDEDEDDDDTPNTRASGFKNHSSPPQLNETLSPQPTTTTTSPPPADEALPKLLLGDALSLDISHLMPEEIIRRKLQIWTMLNIVFQPTITQGTDETVSGGGGLTANTRDLATASVALDDFGATCTFPLVQAATYRLALAARRKYEKSRATPMIVAYYKHNRHVARALVVDRDKLSKYRRRFSNSNSKPRRGASPLKQGTIPSPFQPARKKPSPTAAYQQQLDDDEMFLEAAGLPANTAPMHASRSSKNHSGGVHTFTKNAIEQLQHEGRVLGLQIEASQRPVRLPTATGALLCVLFPVLDTPASRSLYPLPTPQDTTTAPNNTTASIPNNSYISGSTPLNASRSSREMSRSSNGAAGGGAGANVSRDGVEEDRLAAINNRWVRHVTDYSMLLHPVNDTVPEISGSSLFHPSTLHAIGTTPDEDFSQPTRGDLDISNHVLAQMGLGGHAAANTYRRIVIDRIAALRQHHRTIHLLQLGLAARGNNQHYGSGSGTSNGGANEGSSVLDRMNPIPIRQRRGLLSERWVSQFLAPSPAPTAISDARGGLPIQEQWVAEPSRYLPVWMLTPPSPAVWRWVPISAYNYFHASQQQITLSDNNNLNRSIEQIIPSRNNSSARPQLDQSQSDHHTLMRLPTLSALLPFTPTEGSGGRNNSLSTPNFHMVSNSEQQPIGDIGDPARPFDSITNRSTHRLGESAFSLNTSTSIELSRSVGLRHSTSFLSHQPPVRPHGSLAALWWMADNSISPVHLYGRSGPTQMSPNGLVTDGGNGLEDSASTYAIAATLIAAAASTFALGGGSQGRGGNNLLLGQVRGAGEEIGGTTGNLTPQQQLLRRRLLLFPPDVASAPYSGGYGGGVGAYHWFDESNDGLFEGAEPDAQNARRANNALRTETILARALIHNFAQNITVAPSSTMNDDRPQQPGVADDVSTAALDRWLAVSQTIRNGAPNHPNNLVDVPLLLTRQLLYGAGVRADMWPTSSSLEAASAVAITTNEEAIRGNDGMHVDTASQSMSGTIHTSPAGLGDSGVERHSVDALARLRGALNAARSRSGIRDDDDAMLDAGAEAIEQARRRRIERQRHRARRAARAELQQQRLLSGEEGGDGDGAPRVIIENGTGLGSGAPRRRPGRNGRGGATQIGAVPGGAGGASPAAGQDAADPLAADSESGPYLSSRQRRILQHQATAAAIATELEGRLQALQILDALSSQNERLYSHTTNGESPPRPRSDEDEDGDSLTYHRDNWDGGFSSELSDFSESNDDDDDRESSPSPSDRWRPSDDRRGLIPHHHTTSAQKYSKRARGGKNNNHHAPSSHNHYHASAEAAEQTVDDLYVDVLLSFEQDEEVNEAKAAIGGRGGNPSSLSRSDPNQWSSGSLSALNNNKNTFLLPSSQKWLSAPSLCVPSVIGPQDDLFRCEYADHLVTPSHMKQRRALNLSLLSVFLGVAGNCSSQPSAAASTKAASSKLQRSSVKADNKRQGHPSRGGNNHQHHHPTGDDLFSDTEDDLLVMARAAYHRNQQRQHCTACGRRPTNTVSHDMSQRAAISVRMCPVCATPMEARSFQRGGNRVSIADRMRIALGLRPAVGLDGTTVPTFTSRYQYRYSEYESDDDDDFENDEDNSTHRREDDDDEQEVDAIVSEQQRIRDAESNRETEEDVVYLHTMIASRRKACRRKQLHALRGRVEKLRMQDTERTKHQAILQQQQQSTASMPYFSESTTSNMNQSAGSAGRASLPESYGLLQVPGVGDSPPGVSLLGSSDSRSVAVVKDAFLRQHQRVQLISTVLRNHPRFQLYCAPYPHLSEIQKRQVLLVQQLACEGELVSTLNAAVTANSRAASAILSASLAAELSRAAMESIRGQPAQDPWSRLVKRVLLHCKAYMSTIIAVVLLTVAVSIAIFQVVYASRILFDSGSFMSLASEVYSRVFVASFICSLSMLVLMLLFLLQCLGGYYWGYVVGTCGILHGIIALIVISLSIYELGDAAVRDVVELQHELSTSNDHRLCDFYRNEGCSGRGFPCNAFQCRNVVGVRTECDFFCPWGCADLPSSLACNGTFETRLTDLIQSTLLLTVLSLALTIAAAFVVKCSAWAKWPRRQQRRARRRLRRLENLLV